MSDMLETPSTRLAAQVSGTGGTVAADKTVCFTF